MRTTLTPIIVLALALSTGMERARSGVQSTSEYVVSVSSSTPDEDSLIDWALERFEEAELTLPPLDITFHTHRSGCKGHAGLFRLVDGVGDVEICRSTKFLLLHELAHAWEAMNMDDETRAEVLAFWEIDSWNDHDLAPAGRGAEKVADAIAFALGVQRAEPNEIMRRNLCSYPILTGRRLSSVQPFEIDCAASATRQWPTESGGPLWLGGLF